MVTLYRKLRFVRIFFENCEHRCQVLHGKTVWKEFFKSQCYDHDLLEIESLENLCGPDSIFNKMYSTDFFEILNRLDF